MKRSTRIRLLHTIDLIQELLMELLAMFHLIITDESPPTENDKDTHDTNTDLP